jgi:predicted MFS family arabinose efflux permease
MSSPRSRLFVILFTVFIDLVGFGIVMPILPFYAQRFGARGLGFGVLVSAFSLMQFLATALLGRLSDRTGRRPILLVTMLINVAGYLVFAFAGSYPLLLLSRVVCGLAGGNISVAQAYMADVTSPAERSRGMGALGAAFGLGFIVGPALGGLAHHFGGPAAPGLVAATLSLANFASAWFILSESLGHEHRSHRELWDFGHLGEAFTHPRLRPLMIVWGLIPLAFSGYTVAMPLHTKATFGWGEKELGYFFAVVGLTAAVVQGYAFGKLVRVLGERTLVRIGTLGMAVAIGVVPLLSSSAALYAWTIVLASANSVASPALTGLVSIYAGPARQGTILGAAQATSALGRMMGPSLFGTLYDVASAPVVFFVEGAVMLAAAWVATSLASASHGLPAEAPSPPVA